MSTTNANLLTSRRLSRAAAGFPHCRRQAAVETSDALLMYMDRKILPEYKRRAEGGIAGARGARPRLFANTNIPFGHFTDHELETFGIPEQVFAAQQAAQAPIDVTGP